MASGNEIRVKNIPIKKAKEININCQLNNLVITPLTCSAFVMEFTKLLVYEKLQIPYPYSWLKTTVNRRKSASENENKCKVIGIDRYYRTASSALDFLDNLSRFLHNEFKIEQQFIEEVVLCFGTNLATPTEIYFINMPMKSVDHAECNHLNDINKTVNKMLRNVMLTKEWLQVTDSSIPPTNMYVLVKKLSDKFEISENEFFLPKDLFRVPLNSSRINIKFDCLRTEKQLCCANLEIFQDLEDKSGTSSVNNNRRSLNDLSYKQMQWFQSKSCLKGFKDTFINNKSVSNMW